MVPNFFLFLKIKVMIAQNFFALFFQKQARARNFLGRFCEICGCIQKKLAWLGCHGDDEKVLETLKHFLCFCS
jgi:hypothetical protein